MKFAFIDAEKANWAVGMMCDVLDVSRSGYYAWRGRPPSARDAADEVLEEQVVATHKRSRSTYGSPRVHADLRARGVRTSRKRVARLMRKRGIFARQKRRFRRTTNSKHSHPIAPNLLERKFAFARPNRAWVTDVTYIACVEGWLFLAVILDLCSRRVVGWAAGAKNDTGLALEALNIALRNRRPPRGLIHHSDRGSTYASADYRDALANAGGIASMSRSGDCWDNAVAESFFATLKAELVDEQIYETRAAAVVSIGEYIEGFYNVERRHSFINYLCPIEFELRLQSGKQSV